MSDTLTCRRKEFCGLTKGTYGLQMTLRILAVNQIKKEDRGWMSLRFENVQNTSEYRTNYKPKRPLYSESKEHLQQVP